MVKSPITRTMDEMPGKLAGATLVYKESAKAISEYTNAIRALAQVCEDEEIREEYLTKLDEVNGKQGFADAVRSVMKLGNDYTPVQIKALITLFKKMDFSGYSNPMASIHTTLRRMKQSGEVEETRNEKGEKAYRLIAIRGRGYGPPMRIPD